MVTFNPLSSLRLRNPTTGKVVNVASAKEKSVLDNLHVFDTFSYFDGACHACLVVDKVEIIVFSTEVGSEYYALFLLPPSNDRGVYCVSGKLSDEFLPHGIC